MPILTLSVNGKELVTGDIDSSTPLLWVLRDSFGLVGAKFGCGRGFCGACTVHLDGTPIRSCSTPVSLVVGKSIITIEGLAGEDGVLHPLQEAWIEHDVPQCGYCQAGQIMSAAALLAANSAPSDADVEAAMGGNICRCGTYNRIRKAIQSASEKLSAGLAQKGGVA